VYDNSGGHPASRFWAGQTDWEDDLDNKQWQSVPECRRRYALYYADPNLLRAHAAAPFAVMPDQHDDEDDGALTKAEARQVIHEWTALRTVLPDGSGRFAPSPGPDVNVPVPQGDDAQWFYRVLPYGSLAEVLLIDVRRFADVDGQRSQVLGDRQWAWLEQAVLDSAARGVVFRYVVNQVNLSQLRTFNVPFADPIRRQFGLDPNAPQGEFYATAWGAHPAERTRLLRFLRDNDVVDNVVVSGDSHGWFGYDLVEDPEPPSYEPATGGGLLGAVGVELVPAAMGRPGAQDVVAEELYFASVQGGRGAAFTDAERYDREFRTAALPATLGLENGVPGGQPEPALLRLAGRLRALRGAPAARAGGARVLGVAAAGAVGRRGAAGAVRLARGRTAPGAGAAAAGRRRLAAGRAPAGAADRPGRRGPSRAGSGRPAAGPC
jgi:alkaline phosphatase D